MSKLLSAQEVANRLGIPKWKVERDYRKVTGTNKYYWYQIKKGKIRLTKIKQLSK